MRQRCLEDAAIRFTHGVPERRSARAHRRVGALPIGVPQLTAAAPQPHIIDFDEPAAAAGALPLEAVLRSSSQWRAVGSYLTPGQIWGKSCQKLTVSGVSGLA